MPAEDDDHPHGRTALTQKKKQLWNVMMRDGKKLVEDEKWGLASAKFSEAIKLDSHPEAFLRLHEPEVALGGCFRDRARAVSRFGEGRGRASLYARRAAHGSPVFTRGVILLGASIRGRRARSLLGS
jgi:hypothetical protein